ncbi:hypothetical protein EK21DRAFT_13523, partial [Setomelanomma holmii]
MHINDFPLEILTRVLEIVTQLQIRDGPTFTFGLSEALQPFQRPSLQRYVRGFVPPQLLKWDATSAIRSVCWKWHEWVLEHCLRNGYIHRWKGGERWAELPTRRETYLLYELIDRPTGTAVYRDPLFSLKQTARLCNDYPGLASKIRRMWIHDLYTRETDRLVVELLMSCANLQVLSVPWTSMRNLNGEEWQAISTGRRQTLESLELQCINPTSQQAARMNRQRDLTPLQRANFSNLRRLKIFGDTNFMPVTDADLCAIGSTGTQLKEFHVTCNST